MPAVKKRRSWLKWLIALVVIGGSVGAWAWRSAKNKDQPLDLKTAVVARGDIIQSVTANGQIMPVRNVQVGSQVSGIIREIFVDFNSRVTNGQMIAKIDPQTYEQNITQSEAELENAKAAQEYAQLNYKRAKDLRQAELVSIADYEKTVVDLHQAEAVVRMREAALKRANVDLERTTIYAPNDGIVISRAVDVGQTVAASFNTPTLFQIAHDLREMRIEAMVSEADVGGIEEGQQVTFAVDAFPMRQFAGRVSQVRYAPITNQNVVSYTTVVDVRNDDLKLRPGMTATASIITGQREDVVRIPNAALRFRPPEDMLPKAKTNALASAGANSAPETAARPPRGGGEGGPNREEMRRRFESMSPEEREKFRAMREQGGGPGMGTRRRQPAGDGPITRTVYLYKANAETVGKPELKPVAVKLGISDGTYTEVLDGLKEGDTIVSGVNTAVMAASAPPQGTTPFGGPFGGRGGRR